MRNSLIAGLCALGLPLAAVAHPGHGLESPHWHASDALGFLIAGAVAAGLVWWRRK